MSNVTSMKAARARREERKPRPQSEEDGRAQTMRLLDNIARNLGLDPNDEPEFLVTRNPAFKGRGARK